MKRRLTTASLIGNVALLASLLWLRSKGAEEVRTVALAAMRGDELHLQLHAASLAAIESPGSPEAISTADMLRAIIAAGEVNSDARQLAGLGR